MLEREADELDQASLATLEQLDTTISAIRDQLRGESTRICIDCDQEIPSDRLAAASRSGIPVQRCFHCAALEERRRALYRGASP